MLTELLLAAASLCSVLSASPPLGFYPNIILFYADDLGFGDLHNYGHPISITPNLDRLASEGTKIIEFYSSSPVCSPSRAALLTGRFQTRSGIWPGVFSQTSKGGMPHSEITIANLLKSVNTSENSTYATAIIGKWHLGVGGENGTYLPTTQGFDFYTGIPFSHDMPDPVYCFPGDRGCWPSTWPDPWNDTMRDSYSSYSSNFVQNINISPDDSQQQQQKHLWDSTHNTLNTYNNAYGSYSQARRARIKQTLLELGLLSSPQDVITKELLDAIPSDRRVSENIDYEVDVMLGSGTPELPLYLNDQIIQQPVNMTEVPDYYTLNARYFINESVTQSRPFFLYYAFHQTHHPQFSSSKFFNTSQRGMFGDSLAEMDYNVGRVLELVEALGIENETLILFSADNGPSLVRLERGGNAGLLKCGKGTTYEGGVRMPMIMKFPGIIESGRITRGLGSTLDVFPTLAELVGIPLDPNVTYDGYSMVNWIFTGYQAKLKNVEAHYGITPLQEENVQVGQSAREVIYYWPEDASITNAQEKGWWTQSMHAVRKRQFKLHWITAGSHCSNTYKDADCRDNSTETFLDTPLLFNLYHDQQEGYPLTQDSSNAQNNEYYQNIIVELNQTISDFLAREENQGTGLWADSEISKGGGDDFAPCCNWGCEDFPDCCNCGTNEMLDDIAKQYWEAGKILGKA